MHNAASSVFYHSSMSTGSIRRLKDTTFWEQNKKSFIGEKRKRRAADKCSHSSFYDYTQILAVTARTLYVSVNQHLTQQKAEIKN